MRPIRKVVKFQDYEVTYYDRTLKIEDNALATVNEFEPIIKVEGDIFILEKKLIREYEQLLELTSADFVRYATVVE